MADSQNEMDVDELEAFVKCISHRAINIACSEMCAELSQHYCHNSRAVDDLLISNCCHRHMLAHFRIADSIQKDEGSSEDTNHDIPELGPRISPVASAHDVSIGFIDIQDDELFPRIHRTCKSYDISQSVGKMYKDMEDEILLESDEEDVFSGEEILRMIHVGGDFKADAGEVENEHSKKSLCFTEKESYIEHQELDGWDQNKRSNLFSKTKSQAVFGNPLESKVDRLLKTLRLKKRVVSSTNRVLMESGKSTEQHVEKELTGAETPLQEKRTQDTGKPTSSKPLDTEKPAVYSKSISSPTQPVPVAQPKFRERVAGYLCCGHIRT